MNKEQDKLKDEPKEGFAKPDSMAFRAHYAQERRKKRKKRNEEEV
jgi:hypothetical protein